MLLIHGTVQPRQINDGNRTTLTSSSKGKLFHLITYALSGAFTTSYSSLLSTAIISSLSTVHCRYFGKMTDGIGLSHIDSNGQSRMVDVGKKEITMREASAQAIVHVGPEVAALIHDNQMKKGDVLAVARLAGIMAAKRTAELIPLCHNIVLSSIDVKAQLDLSNSTIVLVSTVSSLGQTGVEMESLTAVTVAALTVYDMCKAVTHNISIEEVILLRKTGGKSVDYNRRID